MGPAGWRGAPSRSSSRATTAGRRFPFARWFCYFRQSDLSFLQPRGGDIRHVARAAQGRGRA
eukprot:11177014-Lingulodinium_polyedra.AAC.1